MNIPNPAIILVQIASAIYDLGVMIPKKFYQWVAFLCVAVPVVLFILKLLGM